jgi:NAD+ kinase
LVIKRIGVLYHPMIKKAPGRAKKLGDFLASRGVSVWLCSAWESEQARTMIKGTDLIVTVGGDGTILRASQLVYSLEIPITGVNLGRLGFMTELTEAEAEDGLAAMIGGEGWLDERAMLEANLSGDGGKPQTFTALNDVVMARGAIARLVFIEVKVNGETLTSYKCDGVVVATATGSTGYSLAAGGPILHQHSQDFLLVPVAPHLNPGYPLVMPATAEVRLGLETTHQGTLGVDGHINLPLSTGAVVTVRRSRSIGRFLRVHPEAGFYSSLEQKLKGNR